MPLDKNGFYPQKTHGLGLFTEHNLGFLQPWMVKAVEVYNWVSNYWKWCALLDSKLLARYNKNLYKQIHVCTIYTFTYQLH